MLVIVGVSADGVGEGDALGVGEIVGDSVGVGVADVAGGTVADWLGVGEDEEQADNIKTNAINNVRDSQ